MEDIENGVDKLVETKDLKEKLKQAKEDLKKLSADEFIE